MPARIKKSTYLGGELDNVQHFYCIGNSLIETRNGSDQVTQQKVWDNLAGHYIDSLAEVANNADPGDATEGDGTQELCEDKYHALQDQQFNVLAITDDTGSIVERYEYSLYGERTIMNANYVVLATSAFNMEMGFQGLQHDVETGNIYNRTRIYIPRLHQFAQPDILGGLYPDGMNTYAAYHVMWGLLDPYGLLTDEEKSEISRKLWNTVQDPYICVRGGSEPINFGGWHAAQRDKELWRKHGATIVETGIDLTPGLGSYVGLQQAYTGKGLQGQQLSTGQRVWTSATSLGGPITKTLGKVVEGVKWLWRLGRKVDDCPAGRPGSTKLYHKGELNDGAVDDHRTLSTGTDREAVEALNRSGDVHEFDVPNSKLDEWQDIGRATEKIDNDIETGVKQHEVRIEAGTSGEMNKYKVDNGE